jgi:hypothetical protein
VITTTVAVLVDAQPALDRLAAQPLPVKVAYAVAKLARLIRPDVAQFIAQRNDLIRAHGTEHNGIVEVPPEHRDVYVAQVAALARVEVTLEAAPLDLAALDGARVTANDLIALAVFVVDSPLAGVMPTPTPPTP